MKPQLLPACLLAMLLVSSALPAQESIPGLPIPGAQVGIKQPADALAPTTGHRKITNQTFAPRSTDPVDQLHANIEQIIPNASEDHVFFNLPDTATAPSNDENLHGYVRGYQQPLNTPDVQLPWAQQASATGPVDVASAASGFEGMFSSAYQQNVASAAESAPSAFVAPTPGPPQILASDDRPLNGNSGFTLLPEDPQENEPADDGESATEPPRSTGNEGSATSPDVYSQFDPTRIDPPGGSGAFVLPSISSSTPSTAMPQLPSTGELLWWKPQVVQPLNDSNRVQPTDPNSLVYQALRNSPRILAISKNPLLRELQIAEARADFDPIRYLNSQWDDTNDPVGNELTTGNGELFLRDNIWSASAGVRRKLAGGGNLDLSQQVGFQNSNSRFFQPQDQGTATLALNFSQPLMRGRGQFFNTSQILIAQTATGAEWESFRAELQDELQFVVDAYWQLYFERSVFLQRKQNVVRAMKVLEVLEGRAILDSLPNQIARARSAVLSRKTSLTNSFRDIRNAETELRRLLADPNWMANQTVEMVPQDEAIRSRFELPLEAAIYTALENRTEIRESFRLAKIAAIQHDVSRNELLPELNLLMNTYISALEGGSGIERALTGQFSNGPGYSVGFEFELPVYNRAARSRLAQRKVQMSQIQHEIHEVMQNVIAECQVAHRRLFSAYQTLDAAMVAIEAARFDLNQNEGRWENFALVEGDLADGQSPTTVLDQLLDSQERLAAAELVYAQSELELKLAEIGLRRAQGVLLQHERVEYNRVNDGDTPDLRFLKNGNSASTEYTSDRYPIQADRVGVSNGSYSDFNTILDAQSPYEQFDQQQPLINNGFDSGSVAPPNPPSIRSQPAPVYIQPAPDAIHDAVAPSFIPQG